MSIRTGIALGLSSDGEGYAEVFCGEFSIDCDTSDGRFYIQGSIGDFAWVGLGFDGRRFNWGAGI